MAPYAVTGQREGLAWGGSLGLAEGARRLGVAASTGDSGPPATGKLWERGRAAATTATTVPLTAGATGTADTTREGGSDSPGEWRRWALPCALCVRTHARGPAAGSSSTRRLGGNVPMAYMARTSEAGSDGPGAIGPAHAMAVTRSS